jgi:hypothetical protein
MQKRETDGYFEKMDSKASLRQRNTSTSNLKPLTVGCWLLTPRTFSMNFVQDDIQPNAKNTKNHLVSVGFVRSKGHFNAKTTPQKHPFLPFLQRNAKVLQRQKYDIIL